MNSEYSVIWQRHGGPVKRRVFQRPANAEKFMAFLLGDAPTQPWIADPLMGVPRIEVRDVSEWRSREQKRIEVQG